MIHQCVICDKPVKPTKTNRLRYVHYIDGGRPRNLKTEPEPLPNDPGDCGWHPIGPTCARKLGRDFWEWWSNY